MSEPIVHTHDALSARLTSKTLAPECVALPIDNALSREKIDAWVEVAGNAPFHYPAARAHQTDKKAFEPWRAVKLDQQACRDTAKALIDDEVAVGGLIRMLNAADGMVLVTMLPDPSDAVLRENEIMDCNIHNFEHVAAASCFCQSILTAAQADGWNNYWSSGGPLREDWGFKRFGIEKNQILVGALMFFPKEDRLPKGTDVKSGSLRAKRAPIDHWSRWA